MTAPAGRHNMPRVLAPFPDHGRRELIDHMLVTRNLLAHYRGCEIHNEILHDESDAFGTDRKFPGSDHAPVVATFQTG